ncbi:unnamed protein product, partial [marine sediment metagenome]
MDSKEERELSHYLWSLDNALSGLITLCRNKPEMSDRIITAVESKLNIWIEHKAERQHSDIKEEKPTIVTLTLS